MTEIFKKIIGILIAENQGFELIKYDNCCAILKCDSNTDVIWLVMDDPLNLHNGEPVFAYQGQEFTFNTPEEYIKAIHIYNSQYELDKTTLR